MIIDMDCISSYSARICGYSNSECNVDNIRTVSALDTPIRIQDFVGGPPTEAYQKAAYQPQPIRQRNQANARERDRTHRSAKQYSLSSLHAALITPLAIMSSLPKRTSRSDCTNVNSAFIALRTLIPTEPKERKLSKIETLRLAASYIAHLDAQLIAGPTEQPCLNNVFRNFSGDNEDHAELGRKPVCTFCMSMHKKIANEVQ